MPQPLGNLILTDTVEAPVKSAYQSKLGAKIVWKVGDHNHYSAGTTPMISQKILALLPFDANEPTNPNADRANYGNNRYLHSNQLHWLNSTASDGAWYVAQHAYDASPASARVSVNPYDTWAGFLHMLDDNFVASLLDFTVTVALNTVTDGGGSETVTAKMHLPSTTEVGLANETEIAEGTKFDLFSDNSSRLAYCTQAAIDTSQYSENPTTLEAWRYLIRTPYVSLSCFVWNVGSSGAADLIYAYAGYSGVRPLCNLSSNMLVTDTVNADGNYEFVYSTPLKAQCKVDGVIHTIDSIYSKIDGVWCPCNEPYKKINGIWRQ